MDVQQKLDILGEGAQADISCGSCGEGQKRTRDDLGRWIYPVARPDGSKIMMLKVLQTNACEKDCFYCPLRRSSNVQRTSFQPEELAGAFNELRRQRLAQAIFITSGVAGGGTRTMDRTIATADILRNKYDFRGYLHLKLMPGAESAAIERALQLADRVSINLEVPSAEHMAKISSNKKFTEELFAPLLTAKKLIDTKAELAHKTITTQFIVGAAGETDNQIVSRTVQLYNELNLARTYYAAFQPMPNTPLDGLPGTSLVRENRLYQTDYLLRKYGFKFNDLIFEPSGNLPIDRDPKTIWAAHHPECFPIDLNRASKEELLRVPGIGPTSVSRILQLRRVNKFRGVEDLVRLGADADRAAPFILFNGRKPIHQLALDL